LKRERIRLAIHNRIPLSIIWIDWTDPAITTRNDYWIVVCNFAVIRSRTSVGWDLSIDCCTLSLSGFIRDRFVSAMTFWIL
jgi:hypothetical protein